MSVPSGACVCLCGCWAQRSVSGDRGPRFQSCGCSKSVRRGRMSQNHNRVKE